MALSGFETRERRMPAADRRRKPTPMLSRWTFTGRRRGFRRAGEEANAYVDRLGWPMTVLLVAVLVLCVLDAVFTLLYLAKGGSELNPLMARAIEAGTGPFLAIKCGLTVAGILFLAFHRNFRFVKGILGTVLVLYVLLLGYHLWLASMV